MIPKLREEIACSIQSQCNFFGSDDGTLSDLKSPKKSTGPTQGRLSYTYPDIMMTIGC